MKYSVGNIVVLKNGETICITNYDEEARNIKALIRTILILKRKLNFPKQVLR